MDEIIDTKVVQMKFDNSQFRAGVEDTIKQLTNLENSLEMQGASRGLENVAKASKETSKAMNVMGESVESVHLAFSYLEVAGITAMVRLTNAALSYGKKIANNLWSKSIGQVIEGGKRRSQNISNAKFQLEGLGVAWEDIVDDINYGVKDTAYGLDEAATAASQLVASQVQLGEEMKTALRGISGTAAMTNSSFSEISNIWTTVASNGKLMTMQLRQLSARGLNASAVLAKAMGTTEAAINEMVTKGQIDFKTFAEAMDNAFGEHAKEANKTFQGALSNMNAALSRIGQKFADPVFENLRKVFISLTYDIDSVNRALKPVMDIFGSILNSGERIASAFLTNEHFVKGLINLALDFYSYIRVIYAAVSDFLPSAINVGGISKSFENFAKSLQLYGEKAEKVKLIIKDIISVFDIFIHGVKSALTILRPIGEALLNGIGIPLEKIKENFKPGFWYENRDALKSIMEVISKFIALKLGEIIVAIGKAIREIPWKTVLQAAVILITYTSKAILLLPDLVHIVGTIFTAVIKAVIVAGAAISWFISKVKDGFNTLGSIFGIGFNALFGGISPTISVSADTSAVDDAAEQSSQAFDAVSDSADNATSSVENLNDTVDETSERIDNLEKTVGRSGKEIEGSYKGIGKSALDTAKEVEEAEDRIAIAGKGFNPRGFNPGNPLGGDQRNKSGLGGLTDYGKSDHEPLLTAFGDKEKSLKSGIKSMFDRLAEYAGLIDNDTKAQEEVVSSVDSWFGRIYEAVESRSSTWWGNIASVIGKAVPIIAIIAMMTAQVSKIVVPIILAIALLKIVFKAFDALFALQLSIGKVADAFLENAKANKWRSVAQALAAVGTVLIGVAAVIGVITLAAAVIEQYDLKDTIDLIFKNLIELMRIIMWISIFSVLTTGVNKLADGFHLFAAAFSNLLKPRIASKTVEMYKASWVTILKSMALMFIAIAAEFAVVSGAIKMLGEMPVEQFQQGMTAFKWIGGSLLAMMLLVSLFASRFSVSAKETKASIVKGGLLQVLKGGEGGLTSTLETTGTSIHKVILSLAAFIGIVTAAIIILGNVPATQLLAGGVVLVGVMALIGVFCYFMFEGLSQLSLDMSNYHALNAGKYDAAFAGLMVNLKHIIISLSVFLVSVAIVAKSVENMDWAQIGMLALVLAAAIGGVALLTKVITDQTNNISKNANFKPAHLTALTTIIMSLSVFLSSLAFSLWMMKDIPMDTLAWSFLALLGGLTAVGTFCVAVPYLLSKIESGVEIAAYAKMMTSVTNGISIMALAIAATLFVLSKIDWSAMEGSQPYLIGMGVFVLAVIGLVGYMAKLAAYRPEPIIAGSAGIFIGMSILFYSLGKMFQVMSTIDWAALSQGQTLILATIGIVAAIGALSVILAYVGGPAAAIAIAAIFSLCGMFLAIGGMFALIGLCVSLIGDGVQKIADAINTIVMIPWEDASKVVGGLEVLSDGFKSFVGAMADSKTLIGALAFSIFTSVMAGALNSLIGIDLPSVKMAGEVLNQFFISLATDLDTKYSVVDFLVYVSTILPIVAGGIALAVIMLAVGGIGLIAFAVEMLVFSVIMLAAGDAIKTALISFVNTMLEVGAVIGPSTGELLKSMGVLALVGLTLTVAGALLLAGGITILLASGIILLASGVLTSGMDATIESVAGAGAAILANITTLAVAVVALTALGIGMAAAGSSMIIGGALFSAGSAMVLLGASIFAKAIDVFGNAAVAAGTYANETVEQFRGMLNGLRDIVTDTIGLGPDLSSAATFCVEGFVQGITDGIPSVIESMADLATSGLEAFKDVLGIASPATEMIEAAFWSIEGFIEGLTENAPSLSEVCSNIANGVVSIFSGTSDGMGAAGEDGALSFGTGISDMIRQFLPDLEGIFDSMGIDLGDIAGLGMENQFGKHLKNMIEYAEEVAGNIGYGYWTSDQRQAFGHNPRSTNLNMADIQQANAYNNQAQHDNWWANYVPVDTEDVSFGWLDGNDYYRSFGGGGSSGIGNIGTTSDMASAIAGSSGAGSGINDQSKAASIGGGLGNTITNSNNTYNFYQNNYSPEPLNRSAIYQQTRQQLNGFYTYVKEKNLSY